MIELDEQTQMVNGVRLQTFAQCYKQVLAGKEPWIALGKMMHQFFGAYKQFRLELVRDPIQVPENPTAEQWRWALEERYTLAEPWYYDDVLGEEEEAELRAEAPEAFARRNIFCESNPYRNKYEYSRRRSA